LAKRLGSQEGERKIKNKWRGRVTPEFMRNTAVIDKGAGFSMARKEQ